MILTSSSSSEYFSTCFSSRGYLTSLDLGTSRKDQRSSFRENGDSKHLWRKSENDLSSACFLSRNDLASIRLLQ